MLVIEKYIPYLDTTITYHVGQNALDNFNILDKARLDDIWFHLENTSSGHIICKINEEYNKKELKYITVQGAVLCKQYSKRKSDKKVNIIYTRVKNVTKTNILGQVKIDNFKSITI
jgi:predicted ribosome quality control (RQC) complex YloA/Tae2 family protein